ncbi:hypothetical protein [Halorientalis persicus]|uniref:hypothetical protein n=1 Tax=Halorientalis persicus TaxID=1367881 RepID=UPI0014812BCF|nr:hypothetical protein [Halorientalis persicus]
MGESAHGEGEYGWLTDDDTTASGDTILRVLRGCHRTSSTPKSRVNAEVDELSDPAR